MIWSTPNTKPPIALPALRTSALTETIIERTANELGLHPGSSSGAGQAQHGTTPHLPPPKTPAGDKHSSRPTSRMSRMSTEDNVHLVRNVAEVAAAAAVTAVREQEHGRRRAQVPTTAIDDEIPFGVDAASHGGHDAPNWSRTKSSVILIGATVLYAIIAEILVNTVDVVLENVDVDEKFLGMTLFALVPNTTEFLVCISFIHNRSRLIKTSRMLFHSP